MIIDAKKELYGLTVMFKMAIFKMAIGSSMLTYPSTSVISCYMLLNYYTNCGF